MINGVKHQTPKGGKAIDHIMAHYQDHLTHYQDCWASRVSVIVQLYVPQSSDSELAAAADTSEHQPSHRGKYL